MTDRASNERKEETTFIDVTLWGRTAEVAGEYLSKGRPVLIEGRLQLDQWEDKDSGQKRSKLKVVGETLQMLGGRPEGMQSGASASKPHFSGDSQPPTAAKESSSRSPDQAFYDDSPSGPSDDEVPF